MFLPDVLDQRFSINFSARASVRKPFFRPFQQKFSGILVPIWTTPPILILPMSQPTPSPPRCCGVLIGGFFFVFFYPLTSVSDSRLTQWLAPWAFFFFLL